MVYPNSFEDDPLRMLRAVQFAARFSFMIEPETFRAIRKNAGLLETISSERIAEELTKLLALADQPSNGFRLMESLGLLKIMLPELQAGVGVAQPGGYHAFDVFEHSLHTIDACPPRLRLRMAALFHDICKPQSRRLVDGGATFYGHENMGARLTRDVLERLRFSNEFIQQVSILVDRHMFTTDVTPKGMRRLLRRVGTELIFDLLDLRRADVVAQGMGGTTEDVDQFEADIREELTRKPPLSVSDLAIDGTDIMRLFNLQPGPTVGRILGHLLEKVLDEPESNTRQQLETLARVFYDDKETQSDNSSFKERDL
jgi:tRNA nucleotidyltransferase (CCA-adding enzyme)